MKYKTYTLDDLVTIKYGKNQKKVQSEDGCFPIYGTGGLMGYSNEALYDKPSVLIGRKGTINKVRYVDHPFWTVDTLFYTEVNENIVIPKYLYYLMSLLDLDSYNEGTTIPSLRTETLYRLEFDIPDIDQQKKVLAVIDPIDNKMALNQRINDNLLQQLHQMYLHILGTSDMDISLGTVISTTSGGTPSRKHDEYYSEGSICWVKSKELLSGYIHDTEEHINELAVEKSSAKLLPVHSVLIAMYGATVGAYGIIAKSMTCNQAVCALLSNENYPYTYLFQLACESQQKLINLAVGSAQQNISQVLIKQLPVHSNLEAIHSFHSLAQPMHEKIELLQAENARLANIRDSLLPRLMSGEIDVSYFDI